MSDMAANPETRILVIEDNPETRNLYKDVLTREGYRVFAAEDGEQGWSYVQSVDPHLVLLDMNLPKMTGLEVLRRVRENKESKGVPVIIFTASAEAGTVQNALRLGASDFTMKATVSPKLMVAKIHAILDQRSTPTTTQRYQLALHAGKVDMTKLQEDLGLKPDSQCLDCQGILLFDLKADPTRTDGHWFVGRIMCSSCNRVY